MNDLNTITTTIVTTALTLAGLQITILVLLFRWLRQDIKETNTRIDSLEEKINSRIEALRQEMRTDIGALHSRIDNLYQALFNHKDPAA